MTPPAHSVAAPAVPERTELRLVLVLARKELRDSLRDRWFWMYAAAFAILAFAITSVAGSDAGTIGVAGWGRTAASLVALVQLVVPLMGLTIGARSIAGQRERGTLTLVLSHPVNTTEVFSGIFLGNAAAILAAVSGGFGIAGLVAATRGTSVAAGDLVAIAGLAWLLALAMVGTGMLLSVLARSGATATGMALLVWFGVVLVGDLGLMGTSVATRLDERALFLAAVMNPVEAFRLSAMSVLDGSLDVLGPVGTYAIDRFGGAVRWLTLASLAVSSAVPTVAGVLLFRRRAEP
jgi:Cu-processing system permease protein